MDRLEARWIVLGLVAALLPGGALAQKPARELGEKYALLVGVRQYDKNELRNLPYSEADILELSRVLKSSGYRSENITVMSQTLGAEQSRFLPLGANIRKELRLLLRQRDRADTVLVAFAGHGIEFRGSQEPYFCPMDARLGDKSTLIALNEVYQELGQCKAGLKLLLVDACRNDPQSDHSRARAEVDLESVTRPQSKQPPPGVVALFSCAAGQKAYENDRLKHGVFFNYVIEGLRGKADLDGDRKVVLAELELYTAKRVKDFVRAEYGEEQTPTARHRDDTLPLTPLVSLGQAARGMLGVVVQTVSRELVGQLGLPTARGVLVQGNLPGQASAKAGLRPGDVIVAVNEVEVRDQQHFQALVNDLEAGSQVKLDVRRSEGRLQVKVTLGEKPSAEEVARLFRQVADQGEAWAQYHLGRLYAQGEGLSRSDSMAVSWYRKAAAKGFAQAEYSLGWAYANGRGVDRDDAAAVHWFEKAASQGYSNAQNYLGFMYQFGRGVEKDNSAAVKWYRKAAEQGDVVAQSNLANMYEAGQGVEQDLAQAAHWYRQAAEGGHVPAQTDLGSLYEHGRGVERDLIEAVKWYRMAAERGQPRAQFCLGSLYEMGRGVACNYKEALRWYTQAAQKNYAPAQNSLGQLQARGLGTKANPAEAVKWYRKAAEAGNLEAQANLAEMYEGGHGVEKDYEQAVLWYRNAAERGLPQAQLGLGSLYAEGRGVKKDEVEAVRWYRTAARRGYRQAQNQMGRMYELGRGVEKNMSEAVQWYRTAADGRLPVAERNLGRMYEYGRGVEKDIEEAVKWYRKAAAHGDAEARKCLARLAPGG